MDRVLIFVVAYNAESTLTEVIQRLPRKLFTNYVTEVLVIDDASTDQTFEVGGELGSTCPGVPLTILKNPENLGYGGNQKLGYQYAIREGFDYVVLLHGDGQYAPEEMPRLLNHLIESQSDAVFGSRMMGGRSALKGGMPFYKYLGNRILTSFQNWMAGLKLSEWHTGYRLYSVAALKKIAFERNSNDFDFDTQIILQFHLAGFKIEELPVPTFYGDEICRVNGIKYALQVVYSTILATFSRIGILHDPKFDVLNGSSPYRSKYGFASSHSMGLNAIQENERILVLGCGPVETVIPLTGRTERMVLVDLEITGEHLMLTRDVVQADLNNLKQDQIGEEEFECVLLMDVIEHLRNPEEFLSRLRQWEQLQNARFIITTPNVAFFPLRLMYVFGQFNYGQRGILDKTHTRLFTFGSFKKLLRQQGYKTLKTRGIPAPFPFALGRGRIGFGLLTLNLWAIKLFPRLFSYQIYCEATPHSTVEQLLSKAEVHSQDLRELVLT